MADNPRPGLRARLRKFARPRDPETLPALFHRGRVYVLPTGFGLFFAVALMSMLLGALNYNNNPALLLALLLSGAGLASLIAAQMQLTGLSVVAIDAEPVAAGQPLRVRVHAKAPPERARRGLRVDDDGDSDALAPLDLDAGSGEAELNFATRRRGWFELPRLRVSTTRPLGLARAWAYVWPDAPLLVYPAPEPHGPARAAGPRRPQPNPPPPPRGRGPAAATRSRPACTPAATTSITCAVIAPATPGARSPGSLRRDATRCWCASSSNPWARTWCWTGAACSPWVTKRGSRAWRAGSTRPNATAAATA